ncbi:MAG: hypothetical protein J3K34DRAFT_475770 [Monoraphidium minutum]|nr:MAG: hypothetical protein J3K34DRAFT_475770 [Monoraphidium minutum]
MAGSSPARPRRAAAAATLAALLSLLLSAPGAHAFACQPPIVDCIDCRSSGTGQSAVTYCHECTAGMQLVYTSPSTTYCTSTVPLGPSEARCYYSASAWTTAGPETYREQITIGARWRRRTGYAYFGMTGTNGFTGFCFFGRAMPADAVASTSCTNPCTGTVQPDLCGGPASTPTQRSTCESGFYDSNNVCTPCSVANCATCPTASTCSACESGYGLPAALLW